MFSPLRRLSRPFIGVRHSLPVIAWMKITRENRLSGKHAPPRGAERRAAVSQLASRRVRISYRARQPDLDVLDRIVWAKRGAALLD